MKYSKISLFLLFFSIFIFFYTFYKSEIIYGGLNTDYYLQYYILSVSLFFFSLLTFFLSNRIKKFIFITFVSLLFSFYTLEIFLIFNNFQKSEKKFISADDYKLKEFEKKYGKKFDLRSKYKFYNDEKNNFNNLTAYISPRDFISDENLEIFPLSGSSKSNTILCNENGYYPLYKSDRYGFRNPDILWEQKNIDILIIGESYFAGACVNDENTIVGNLRDLFNDKKIINLSYIANGPLIELATLVEFIQILKPKKILWAYREDRDLYYLSYEKRNKILNNYILDENFSQNIVFNQDLVDRMSKKKFKSSLASYSKQKKINLKNLLKLRNLRTILQPKKSNQLYEDYELFFQIINKAFKISKFNQSDFYFVYLPHYNNFTKDEILTEKLKNQFSKISSNLKKNNIKIIDVRKKIINHTDPLSLYPFRSFGHLNEKGYSYVSKIIFDHLKE